MMENDYCQRRVFKHVTCLDLWSISKRTKNVNEKNETIVIWLATKHFLYFDLANEITIIVVCL